MSQLLPALLSIGLCGVLLPVAMFVLRRDYHRQRQRADERVRKLTRVP